MKSADLHLHTVFSDSTYTPQELIQEALSCGLAAISVVDHDTTGAIELAKSLGEEKNIEVIPGIELTAEYDGLEVHILGYFIHYENEDLRKKLELLKKARIERIHKITDKLKRLNIKLEPEKVFALATHGTVGRLHLARAMVKEGIVDSLEEAFRKYIGEKGPAYVAGFKFSPDGAIKFIRDFGGIPVLAHPHSLHNDDLIFKFIDYGLKGLEVYYPGHTQGMINLYLGIAKKFNLVVTGGSDCHGNAKPEVKIGSIKIPYELVEKLKQVRPG